MRALLLAIVLLGAAVASASPPPAGSVRYCVTPLWPWPQGLWVNAVIEVAPERAALQGGDRIWLKFVSKAAAAEGSRGCCWWVQAMPPVSGKPNARKVVGYAP